MDDQELLELAAKAAGYKWDEYGIDGEGNWWTGAGYLENWDPQADDGCALRLMVALGLTVIIDNRYVTCHKQMSHCHAVAWSVDRYAATRLAILLVAVDLGRAMP